MPTPTHLRCARGKRLWVASHNATERCEARTLGRVGGVVLGAVGPPGEPFPYALPPDFRDCLPLCDVVVLYREDNGPVDVAALYAARDVPPWTTIDIVDAPCVSPVADASDEDEVEDVVAGELVPDDDSL